MSREESKAASAAATAKEENERQAELARRKADEQTERERKAKADADEAAKRAIAEEHSRLQTDVSLLKEEIAGLEARIPWFEQQIAAQQHRVRNQLRRGTAIAGEREYSMLQYLRCGSGFEIPMWIDELQEKLTEAEAALSAFRRKHKLKAE